MQIWAESGKSALPICNYSQILYQFLTFTQNLKRSRMGYLYVSLNAQIRNITLLHSSSTSNNNYPQYKAPPPDYAPVHGLSSLLS